MRLLSLVLRTGQSIAPTTFNDASVVATHEQITQNPGDFFVLNDAGLVSQGFINISFRKMFCI